MKLATSAALLPDGRRDLGRRPDRLLVPDGQRVVPLALTKIGWIRAEGDYARIHADGKSYVVYRRPNDLEMRFDPSRFLRIHRSAIVCLDQIAEVQPRGQQPLSRDAARGHDAGRQPRARREPQGLDPVAVFTVL